MSIQSDVTNGSRAEVGDIVTVTFKTDKPVNFTEVIVANVTGVVNQLDARGTSFSSAIFMPSGLPPFDFAWSVRVRDVWNNEAVATSSTDGTDVELRCDDGNPVRSWIAGSGFFNNAANYQGGEQITQYSFVSLDSIVTPASSIVTVNNSVDIFALRVLGTIRIEDGIRLNVEDKGCPPGI